MTTDPRFRKEGRQEALRTQADRDHLSIQVVLEKINMTIYLGKVCLVSECKLKFFRLEC